MKPHNDKINIYPEIQLRVQDASEVSVDILVYPEDRYLIVDPYSSIAPPKEDRTSLVNYAIWSLPRRLGEVIVSKGESIKANYLMKMVVVDFEAIPQVQTSVFEEAIKEVFKKAGILKARSICFDRLDLVERYHSAYKVMSTLVRLLVPFQLQAASRIKLFVLTFNDGPVLRRFEIACSNLYPYSGAGNARHNF